MMKLFSNISLRIDIKSKIVISKYLLCFSNKKKTRTKAGDCLTMPRVLFKQFRFPYFCMYLSVKSWTDQAHKLQVFF